MSSEKYDSSIDDYTTAEALVKRALEIDSNDAEVWAFSAVLNKSFQTRGFDRSPARLAAAREQARRAVKLAPDSIEAQFARGFWMRDVDPAEAERIFRKILERQPDYSGALFGMSTLTHRSGRLAESQAYLDRVSANPAQAPLAGYLQFLGYFGVGNFADADRVIRRSIALKPAANSEAGLAMLLLAWKGDAAGAAQVFATGAASSRNEPRTIWMTAQVQLCARQPEAVLNTLDRLADDFIQDSWYVGPKAYFVGRAHALAGRPEAARLAWQAGVAITEAHLKTAPENRDLHLIHGEQLALLGRTDEALREVRIVTELDREKTAPWFVSPVKIYAALGRADDALPLLASLVPPKPGVEYGWPLTPALLKLDPLWDKIRSDSRFQALTAEPQEGTALASTVPLSPARELANKALALQTSLEATREDFALAEDYCQRALKLDSTDGEIWAIYSELNSAYGYRGWDTSPERREQTRVMAERAIRLAPTSVEARLAQAGWWAAFGVNRDQREKLLREVVRDQPDNHAALRFLAVTVLGRPDGLEECLAINERSAALPGGDPLALYNNARYLLQRGRPAEAFATIERALTQREFSSALVFKIAMDVRLHGDLANRAATLRRIPESVLLEDRANYTAGLVRFLQHDADAALAAWGGFPRDYYADYQYEGPKGLLIGLADELDHRDAAAKIEWKAALALVDKRIATTPNNPAPYYYKAYLLACLDEKAAAGENLSTYEQLSGFKLAPGVPLSLEMAVVYARLGRLDEILAHLPVNGLLQMRIDPRFEALRADPRFERLVAQQAASDPKPKP